MANLWRIALLKFLLIGCQVFGQNGNTQCDERSCYPATGDLMIGRSANLTASSTCGMTSPEDYCIVAHLQANPEECFVCDTSIPDLNHEAENMISTFNGNRDKTWWQSENLKENVYLQLDLEAQFHFTHLVMTFRTFRPAGMLIERSWDYGRNWHVYRYFAADCEKTFPGIPHRQQKEIDDVICTEDFSSVEPSSNGEVIFRALNPQIPIKNPYSEKVQNLLKLTNIRINFTKLHTLGDLVLDPTQPEARLKYYYAVYNLVIRGSCSCYGHAEQCLPLDDSEQDITGMVHGRCDCAHNTEGKNCERCKDGYNDTPWRPATVDDSYECKKCDCNGHAEECRFDPAAFANSNFTSGGVCVNCLHNTVGRKCEKCKPLHFQDPSKDFRDSAACIPCNCDSVGGISGGECEGKTDEEAGLVGGRCICKKNVEGSRCSRCKPGFWNLRRDNDDGCTACGCSPLGTLGVCNPKDGKCLCKRYVMGPRCDRCQPGFWGLGNNAQGGCKPCSCDVGGAYERNCEQVKGQCRCRKGITGRKCDKVQTGNFFPLPDHLKYESEEAKIIGGQNNGKVVPREPQTGEDVSWTGDGFVEIKDKATLEYAVTNVPYTGEYNILVRYEPKDSGLWQVNVMIQRLDGLPLTSGKCVNATNADDPNYGNFSAILQTRRRYVLMLPSVCLEKDVSYVVKVTYSRDESNKDGVDSILTDSMVLVPYVESVSIFQGPDGEQRKKVFDQFSCLDFNMEPASPRPQLPDVCKQLLFAMSSVIYDGGKPCNCDPTGTKRDENGTLICDSVGGQCKCKPNVIGQRCDRCAPGSFGFGPQGCAGCNCNSIGASDNLCNAQTGQCTCRIKAGGRQCNLCPPRNWGFPLCRPCRCNGHDTSNCHPKTGECLDCQHNTAGKNCEVCATGYYGDATKGTPKDCRRCQCPGGGTGNQFSATCRSTGPDSFACDACEVGYRGTRCEECADGYYGNPLVPGGRCKPCSCNNNIDPSNGGTCDRTTGRCSACLYNTAGFSCERCKSGFYGDAIARNCTKCVCNINGTAPGFVDTCNYETGQCKCLSNVIGIQCDKCADGFWNLGSGKGCQKCDCCGEGSTQATCNQDDGQCTCKPGYGGPRCCACESGYWGTPLNDCKPCDCNLAGSVSLQCDRDTGKCQCKQGMIGDKCDQCAQDTSGKMPQCEVCGECYYQWKVTLESLSRNISLEVPRAYNVSLTPQPGSGSINAYDKDLKELEDKLERVEMILKNQVTTENDTMVLEKELDSIDMQLQEVQDKVDMMKKDVRSSEMRTEDAKTEIQILRERLANLTQGGTQLKSNVEKILRSDIRGAFEEILKNQMRSRQAEARVNESQKILDMSKEQRNITEQLLEGPPSFLDRYDENSGVLFDILDKIRELQKQVGILNGVVCGSPSSKCGGCGVRNCSFCGGPGCNGSLDLAMKAVERAREAEAAQRMREAKANEALEEVRNAEVMVNMTKEAADKAVMRAMDALARARNASDRMDKLIQDILDFLDMEFGDTDIVRKIADGVKQMKLSVTPEEIEKLAEDIKLALSSLTGIDEILEETTERLDKANDLKERAEKARMKAKSVSAVIGNITNILSMAGESQATAEGVNDAAQKDIERAETILKDLQAALDKLEKDVDTARANVTNMAAMIPMVTEQFDKNQQQLAITEQKANDAHGESVTAEKEADELMDLFNQAKESIEDKDEAVKSASKKVVDMKEQAIKLIKSLQKKMTRIIKVENTTISYEDLIQKVTKLQGETKVLLAKLDRRFACYFQCSPDNPNNPCFED